jgi:hypothetical protein
VNDTNDTLPSIIPDRFVGDFLQKQNLVEESVLHPLLLQFWIPLGLLNRKNSSNTCFFLKRDSPASWVADSIWQQHLEESKVPNPIFSKF